MFPTNLHQKPTQDCIHWAQKQLNTTALDIQPMPEHAHKDKHLYTVKLTDTDEQWLLVEAYQDVQSMLKFITLSKILRNNQIHTPEILSQEITTHRCWVIMSHFGHETLLDWLLTHDNPDQKRQLIEHCLTEIKQFQKQKIAYPVPNYTNNDMFQDMSLTETYFIEQLRNSTLHDTQKAYMAHIKTYIIEAINTLPKGLMHFDFHSANLMLLPHRTLGVLDFQDLKIGPINYDLVSLLTDHYYQHDAQEITDYIDLYYAQHLSDLQKQQIDTAQFHYLFNIVAVQRHLKNIGIFSRLFFNQKQHYIQHIPKMMQQLKRLCVDCKQLQDLPDILWSSKAKHRYSEQVHKHCQSTLSTKQIDALLATVD